MDDVHPVLDSKIWMKCLPELFFDLDQAGANLN